jgi:hypothetical protein
MKIIATFFMSFCCMWLFAYSKNDIANLTQNNGSDTTSNKMKITNVTAVFTPTLNNNAELNQKVKLN